MTDWFGRPIDSDMLEQLGVGFATGRAQAPDEGIVFPTSLRKSFEEYLASPVRRVRRREEIRDFLRGCRYEEDSSAFRRLDVWLPPAEFERRRVGDCEDHAIWAWVQLVRLGVDARFMTGYFKTLHAWVVLYPDVRVFEATDKHEDYSPGEPGPLYDPLWSVDGRLRFYWHRPDFWRGPALSRP